MGFPHRALSCVLWGTQWEDRQYIVRGIHRIVLQHLGWLSLGWDAVKAENTVARWSVKPEGFNSSTVPTQCNRLGRFLESHQPSVQNWKANEAGM